MFVSLRDLSGLRSLHSRGIKKPTETKKSPVRRANSSILHTAQMLPIASSDAIAQAQAATAASILPSLPHGGEGREKRTRNDVVDRLKNVTNKT